MKKYYNKNLNFFYFFLIKITFHFLEEKAHVFNTKKMLYGLKREKCRKNKTNELFYLSSPCIAGLTFFSFFPKVSICQKLILL